jgi:hypothetical protein
VITKITTHISVPWKGHLFCCWINLFNLMYKSKFVYLPYFQSAVFTLCFYRNRRWMHKRRQPKTRGNQGTVGRIFTAANEKRYIKNKRKGCILIQSKFYPPPPPTHSPNTPHQNLLLNSKNILKLKYWTAYPLNQINNHP